MTNPIPSGRPLAREFFSLPTSGVPFIPELHTDDCNIVDCARCVTPAPLAALDVPLPVVESQARTLAGCLAEQQHLLDPADHAFAALACRSDCCSTDETYPEWAAALAARTHTGGQA